MPGLTARFGVGVRLFPAVSPCKGLAAHCIGCLLLLGLVVGFATGAGSDEVPSAERTGGIDLRDVQHIEAGYKIFAGLCAGYCHGTGGTAKRGPALRNRPELKAHTLFYTIANGRRRSGNPMPPWKGLLSEKEIWQVVAYIVSLRHVPPLAGAAPSSEK